MRAAILGLLLAALTASAQTSLRGRDPVEVFLKSGVRSSIPIEEILRAGPRVDGIPSLDEPVRVSTGEAEGFLSPDDIVLGFVLGGQAAAYPLRFLNWHEVVNDEVGKIPVTVAYCPLTRAGLAFDRRLEGRSLDFGVSGLVYKSNRLLYDRQTLSLWSQFFGEAVAGSSTGSTLRRIPVSQVSWRDWKSLHPGATVLGPGTLRPREYGSDPYAGYETSRELYFPAGPADGRLHPKELVFGFEFEAVAYAVPLSALRRAKRLEIRADRRRIAVDAEAGPRARLEDGSPLEGTLVYWFAWTAFHPASRLVRK